MCAAADEQQQHQTGFIESTGLKSVAMKTNTARMTVPISQLKRSVLSTINFSEKDFPAAIGGSGETLPE
jgi:hypothetical protein